eukprot:g78765.t1
MSMETATPEEQQYLNPNEIKRGVKRTVTDQRLRRFNIAAMILHSIQAVPSIKDFSKSLTTSYLAWDPASQSLKNYTKASGQYFSVGLAAAIFLLLSALAHATVLLKWVVYVEDINREINRFRWYEYMVSSSIMIMAIAVLFGCYDLGTLILMFFANGAMNLFGLLHERLNPPERQSVNWEAFVFGCFAGTPAWIVIFMYFLGGGNFDNIPGFVYGILAAYVFFFNCFPINMVLQYKRVGRWSEYRYGELVYIILSLVSKSLLAWLVFGGTFQPSD